MGKPKLKDESSGRLDAIKVGIGVIIIILFGFLAAYSMASDGTISENKPVVVATSTNLGYFAEEVGGEEIDVRSIVPPGYCPGHYDTLPSDVNAIANADLVLWGGIEPWIEDLIANSGNEKVILNKTPAGPWGPPWGAKKYIENITDALTLVFPQHKESFEKRENQLISRINSCADNLKEQAIEKNLSETKVICQQFQKGFVEWLGFEVVKTYPSPEQVSNQEIENLINVAQSGDVAMIFSNNPSGTSVGEGVVSETEIEHVVLSNFPGSREDTYCEMIRSNAQRLFSAKEAYES